MLELVDICKTYASRNGTVEALKNINIRFDKGDIVGIIGLSGAGKSTLVRCINLLERPTTGKILYNGQDVTSLRGKALRSYRRGIGMVFQHYHLFSQRTVAKNVAFPLEVAKIPKPEREARVIEMLELVGLADKAGSYPSELSGGQRQRVSIARALASNPGLLLCDEPTSALDSLTTRNILKLLLDINKTLGITIVIITHEIHVVRSICRTMAVIDSTRIVEQGSAEKLLVAARTGIARQLIGLEDIASD